MRTFIRLASLLCIAPILTACAPMLAMLGTNTTLVQGVAQIERVKLAGDGASYVSSHKTITDHALSKVIGKECKIFNVLTNESVCGETTPVIAADSDTLPKKSATTDVATGVSTAVPDSKATAHNAPSIDVSNSQASGD